MTKIIYNLNDLILVQSPEFKSYIKNQNVSESKMIYYPYYAEEFYRVVEKQEEYKKLFPLGLIWFLQEILSSSKF